IDDLSIDAGDTDEDGLSDIWELDGIDADGDGTIDLDLAAMGASPYRKDLFVEVDAMSGLGPIPTFESIDSVVIAGLATDTSLDLVVAAFLNAPVPNPDGSTGIDLHLLLDELDLPYQAETSKAEYQQLFADHLGSPLDTAATKLAKRQFVRYALFANSIEGSESSGFHEGLGNEFVVTLGEWNEQNVPTDPPRVTRERIQAGTFMHELGHSLGLQHGGGDDLNYKPNYHSVMNYLWQTPIGIYADGWLPNFSSYESTPEDSINEALFYESQGIAPIGSVPLTTIFVPAGGVESRRLYRQMGPIDWNLDGDTNDVVSGVDLNRDGITDSILRSYNDWFLLRFSFLGTPGNGDDLDFILDDLTPGLRTQEESIIQPAVLRGDFNQDGSVDILDFGIWVANLTTPEDLRADGNRDGTVDGRDLLIWQQDFGLRTTAVSVSIASSATGLATTGTEARNRSRRILDQSRDSPTIVEQPSLGNRLKSMTKVV
ncbi:MAG: hypothetical protein KDA99_12095, partial [Planctomycetales bacterium]|nr:hypothetical protein [Planctomycetales bacterium]